MGRISWREALRRLESFNMDEAAVQVLSDDKEDLAEKNRQQLLQGLDSTGKKMAPYKNSRYAAKKYAMNTAAGRGTRDLKLTGAFHAGIHVYVLDKGRAVFTSSDPKTRDIVRRDGVKIFGLTPENLHSQRAERLRPGVLRRLNAALKQRALTTS